MDQFADGMSFASSTRKGRGVSWRHQEILDLLDIWGRPKIQEQLHASHRNMDAFEIVAREMHRRGHRRSAVECRSKTKAMRLEYQRVVSHNSSSGKHTATCPYYEKLHSILRGDASSWPKRIPRTLKSIRGQSQLTQDLVPEHFEELYTQDMQTENIEGAEESRDGSALSHKQEDLADDSIEVCIVEDNSDAASDGIGAESEPEQAEAEMEREQDVGIQNHQASPSTTACLTMMRTKKRKKGEGDMFERLMQHSSMENARLLAALEKDSKVFSEYMRHMREEDLQIREERRAFLHSIDNLGIVLQSLVSGLNKIGEALVKPNHGAAGGLAGGVPCLSTFSGCVSSMLGNRERAPSESTSQPGSPESTSLETLAAMKDASCVPNGQRPGEPFWG